jgi:hypothetical protein
MVLKRNKYTYKERVVSKHMVLHGLSGKVVDVEVVCVDNIELGDDQLPVIAQDSTGPGQGGLVLFNLK